LNHNCFSNFPQIIEEIKNEEAAVMMPILTKRADEEHSNKTLMFDGDRVTP